jgi:hypothetical protein
VRVDFSDVQSPNHTAGQQDISAEKENKNGKSRLDKRYWLNEQSKTFLQNGFYIVGDEKSTSKDRR